MLPELPRLLHDFRPLTGMLKTDYEDFQVEEIPLYPADGHGTHTYFLLEKAGLSTPQAVHDIAQALNVARHDIGFAGQKDSRAVTRQWLSVEHVAPAVVQALEIPRLRVLEVTRHGNKLRLGHLKGNRFLIRVRQAEDSRLAELEDALGKLMRVGVPNYFGPQRFGQRGNNWEIGRAMLRGAPEEAISLLLGRPGEGDYGGIRRARELYEQGNYAAAAHSWPIVFHTERRVLRALQRGGDLRRALSVIDRFMRQFYVSAYQSHLFNRVVAARLETGLGQLWEGDLAWLHASGAVFRVLDAAIEQPRADRLEISPTGPLFGHRMTQPEGQPFELEQRVLTAEELPEKTLSGGPIRVQGARRALRFIAGELRMQLGADARGAYLELGFSLPRGCYATALLRELVAEQSVHAAAEPGEPEERGD